MKLKISSLLIATILTATAAQNGYGQDSVFRLLDRASENRLGGTGTTDEEVESGLRLLPASATPAPPASATDDQDTFAVRSVDVDPTIAFHPESIQRDMFRERKRPGIPPGAYRDELLFNGYDRKQPVTVDQSWNVYGLETEDAIAHFDTLDGQRLVSPGNRVAIYAPRFGAVRKVSGFGMAERTAKPGHVRERMQMQVADGEMVNDITTQFDESSFAIGSSRPSILEERTRALPNEAITRVFGVTTGYKPFENIEIMRIGRMNNSETARLQLGINSALAWQDNLGLQVVTNQAQPIIVVDTRQISEVEAIETKGDNAVLRVLKLASKLSARPGDIVEFSIRFDNLSRQRVGNVTVIDNLTPRLQYVEGSAECSLESDFLVRENEAGSLELRWEIIDPLPRSSGGLIRFRCKVR